jgi:branched-subunit amino acid transport protein
MTWAAVLALAAAAYALKALGPVAIGRREIPARFSAPLDLLPIPMLTAIALTGTVASGQHLQVDARLPGLAVAAILVWRRAPFLAVIVAAAATTALIRAF